MLKHPDMRKGSMKDLSYCRKAYLTMIFRVAVLVPISTRKK